MTDFDVWLTTPPEPSEVWYMDDCEACGERLYEGGEHVRYDGYYLCVPCAEKEVDNE